MFDYTGRILRLQESLRESGVVGGVVLKPSNVRYLSGFWGYATRAEYFEPRRLICLVVPTEGAPLVVTPKIEHTFAVRATLGRGIEVRRHVEWEEAGETEDAWGIVRDFLRERGRPSGRVSVEREHITQRAYEALAAGMQDYELVSGGGVIERMRMIKDPDEIALLRQCGRLAVEMLEVEIAAIRRGGVREIDVALAGWSYVVRRCAEEMAGNEVNSPIGEGVQLVTSGPRLAMAHGSASTRNIQPDDLVMMDFCRVPFLHGYRTGMGRVVAQRPLTSEEDDIEATIQRAYQTGLSLLRPGVPCGDVEAAVRDILVGGGVAEFVVHRSGRGVGIENVEAPELKQGIETRLETNMVIGIEPSVYRSGFASRVEDTVLITRDGPEVMTAAPPNMRRLFRVA